MSGLELVKQLKERYPTLLYLMLSGHGETSYLQQAFSLGVRGYLLKGDPSELREAIQTVTTGGVYLNPILQNRLSEAGE